jgi:hypothetical protein
MSFCLLLGHLLLVVAGGNGFRLAGCLVLGEIQLLLDLGLALDQVVITFLPWSTSPRRMAKPP